MHIYKFRLLSDLSDEFVRDIEIQATQTFEDFHNMIATCTSLNIQDLASFHICDQKWNKMKEITLIDMFNGEVETDEDKNAKMVEETFIMRDSRIKDFIDEPHQRLIYVYDFLNMNALYIELLSVHKQKDEAEFPRCTLNRGELLQPTTAIPPLMETLDEDDELSDDQLEDIGGLLDDTFDYKEDNDSIENSPL